MGKSTEHFKKENIQKELFDQIEIDPKLLLLAQVKENILKQMLKTLAEHLAQSGLCSNVSFPEMVLPLIVILDNYQKASTVQKY